MSKKIPKIHIKSLSRLLMSDFLTPVSVYHKIRHLHEHSFLLESVQQNERIGRYSIVGINPLITFKSHQEEIKLIVGSEEIELEGNPFDLLKELHQSVTADPINSPDFDFSLTWIGYVGYDMIRNIENIPNSNKDGYNVPESFLVLPSILLVIDHVKQVLNLITLSIDDDENQSHLDEVINNVINCLNSSSEPMVLDVPENDVIDMSEIRSNVTEDEFKKNVIKGKQHIVDGDVFQVVLSQRFEMDYDGDYFMIYRTLRRINPSPYMYCLSYGDFQIIGSSPEMLVQLEADKVMISPIAGTRPRGKTPEEEKKLEEDLLSDEKELAEHRMLIDLARNDIGRVCQPGSVTPEKMMFVENYSHVKHIVSNVSGKLEEQSDAIDLIKAVFPAGTLSGTPKIRAMEIIDDLENVRRGIYAGSIIFWNFKGYLNSCIIIRSVLIQNGKAYIQAGAGIVNDSTPEMEYIESVNKASAVIAAIIQSKKMKDKKKPSSPEKF